MAEAENASEQVATGPWADLTDWSTWDRQPWPDQPPLCGPPDPKRPTWGGACAGPGEDGKGCHARWSSLWSGKRGEPAFCKLVPCYAQWKKEKRGRDASHDVELSPADQLRRDRKRAREEAAAPAQTHPVDSALPAPTTPATPVAVVGTWEPISLCAILGQRWKEPSAVQPWQRRSITSLGSGDIQVIAFGKYSEAPGEDTEGVPDAQWRTLAELTATFGADVAHHLWKTYLADIARAGHAAINAAEAYATEKVGSLGAGAMNGAGSDTEDNDETQTPAGWQAESSWVG